MADLMYSVGNEAEQITHAAVHPADVVRYAEGCQVISCCCQESQL